MSPIRMRKAETLAVTDPIQMEEGLLLLLSWLLAWLASGVGDGVDVDAKGLDICEGVVTVVNVAPELEKVVLMMKTVVSSSEVAEVTRSDDVGCRFVMVVEVSILARSDSVDFLVGDRGEGSSGGVGLGVSVVAKDDGWEPGEGMIKVAAAEDDG
jgi:hypothetical protein